jgi:hypothetical protein
MFRSGGKVDSKGTGITSGLEPKRGIVDGPGGYAGEKTSDIYKRIRTELAPAPGLSLGDYLQIAAAGADILGAPSEGGGIKGTLATVSKPLATLGRGLATTMGKKESDISQLAGALTEAELKSQGEFGKREAAFNALYETKKQAIQNDVSLSADQKAKQLRDLEITKSRDYEFYVIKGGDVSDYFKLGSQKEAIEAADKAAKNRLKAEGIGKDSTSYASKLAQYQAEFLSQFVQQFGKQFAEGGAVTADTMDTTDTQNQSQLQMISYDELRARLPQQITDDIVKLLSTSYEALADFAEIQTQADVNAFNEKYNVQLVLPQGE